MKVAKRVLTSIRPRRIGRFRRQAVSLLLAVAMTVQGLMLVTPGEAGAESITLEGHGIEGDPYIVTSAEDLDQVRYDLSAWYELGNDISLTGNWKSIGIDVNEYGLWYSNPFTGHFDGAGFSIAGLTINTGGTYQSSAGLFGHVGKSGVVENLTLQSPDVTGIGYLLEGAGALAGQLEGIVRNVHVVGGTVAGDGIADIGGLIGSAMADSLIENSSSSASVASNYGYYGGLVGELAGGSVTDSYATGNADSPYNINGGGGLIGSATNAAISGSHASGDVTGAGTNGGLIGNAANTNVSDSYAEGSVTIDANWEAGGLIGRMSGGSVTDSYALGNTTGSMKIGGLIGNAANAAISGSHASGRVSGNGTGGGLIGYAKNSKVEFSYAEGQVVADGGMYAGGLIGQMSMGEVTDSYATGAVSGYSQIGGLIGSAADDASISRTYSQGAIDGSGNVGGLVGDLVDSAVSFSFAAGNVNGYSGSMTGGLIGYLSGSSVSDSYAAGNVTGAWQVGGLAGNAENASRIERAYARGKVYSGWDGEARGLVGAMSMDSTVTLSYYDKLTTGQTDKGRGEPLATADMGREGVYAYWDFSDVWQLDDRVGYPALIAFDRTPPSIKSASVKNESSDRIELIFQEKIAADADVLAHFLVQVDSDPVSVDEADGFQIGAETRTLTLVLIEPIKAGQTVTVTYEAGAASPLRDLAGNKMDDDAVTADNLVESKLEIVQLSPADNAENIASGTALTIVFSDAVTPVAGKRIELRKSADGRLVESFDASDAGHVTAIGDTVTIIPSAALASLTGYYATVEAGAFRDAEDRPNMAIAGTSRWNFTTAADSEAAWLYAGNAGVSGGAAGSPDLFHDNGTLYVAYVDRARGDRITVMKYADAATGWTAVGSQGFSADGARDPSLFVAGGIPYIAYEQRAGADVQVAVMKFDGSGDSGWAAIGAPLPSGAGSEPSLYVDGGIAYIAFHEPLPDLSIHVYLYDPDSGQWEALGESGGISTGFSPSIAIDSGTPYIVFQDYDDSKFGATVMTYDAVTGNWLPVGTRSFTGDSALNTKLAIDGGTLYVSYEIAYLIVPDDGRENTQSKAAVMKFDSASGHWISIGAAGFSKDQAMNTSLSVFEGEPYVAYTDRGLGDTATVMKYTGSRWEEVGSGGFSAGMAAEPSIAFMNGIPYVAFEDKGNGRRISVMTYAVNDAPTASGVQATGTPEVGLALTGDYVYADADDDPEGDSTLRWYAADDASGANRTVIADASGRTLTLGPDQIGKYILFEVTPQARSGKLTGSAVSSTAVGPVTAADHPAPPLVIALSPMAGADGVATDASLSLTFSESVSAVPAKQLSVWKQADDSLVEALDAANPADISVTGATYGYRLSEYLEPGTAYYVLVDAGAFENAGGIAFAGIADAAAWTFTTVDENPPVDSENADLANLTLTGAAITPKFRPDVISYTANASHSVGSVTVTAAVYDNFAGMTVNGRPTISGTPVDIALGIGSNPIRVEVTAQDGVTKKLYTVNVTRAPEPDPGDDSEEEQRETEEDQPGDEGFEVIVNGQRHERIAASRLTQLEGRSAIAVTVDASRLTAQIKDVANPTIVIPVTRQADHIYVELTGDAIAALGRQSGVLELQTPLGTYRIPAAKLPVSQLSPSFGGPIDAAQMSYRVNIAQGDADRRTLLEEAARKGDFLVATPPVDFSVTVSYGGQTLEVERFETYVEREIPLPEGADPSRITTAVVLESDGTVRHVPTYVSRRDGKYVAIVNSLTNSTYALILHSAAFKDMAGHWAEQAVADMGSRLIASGVDADRFAPDAPVTRAQFLSIAIRALGLSDRGTSADFRDIADGAWYAGAVAKAAEYGIVRGYEDGTFRPDKTITRAEAFVIAASAMKLAGLDTGISAAEKADTLSAFSDGGRIGAWAAPAAAAAVKHGLVRGYQGALHPDASLTRAETAILLRMLLIRAGLIDDTEAY